MILGEAWVMEKLRII